MIASSMPRAKRTLIRANVISLGGGLFLGLFILLAVFTWFAFNDVSTPVWVRGVFATLLVIYVLYVADSASERLSLHDKEVRFDSLFRKELRVDVCRFPEIFLIHEGLNQEKGIVSVIFRGLDEEERISLGPLWRQRDLEGFFVDAEKETGECRLVKKEL